MTNEDEYSRHMRAYWEEKREEWTAQMHRSAFENGAAVAFGIIALGTWAAEAEYRQMTCGVGIHSFGHGEVCHYCGARDDE